MTIKSVFGYIQLITALLVAVQQVWQGFHTGGLAPVAIATTAALAAGGVAHISSNNQQPD